MPGSKKSNSLPETSFRNPSATPDARVFEDSIRYHVRYSLAKDWTDVSNEDLFHAVSLAVKELAIERLLQSERRYRDNDAKRVYYFSMEFLTGRTLENNLVNLGLLDQCREAFKHLGRDLNEIFEEESDPALGNGGLGRLAACFLDSLATQGMPGFGYGINYEFGLFKQEIQNGYQTEAPDRWLSDALYWQIPRPEKAPQVPIYGRIVDGHDVLGKYRPQWVDFKMIQGEPHDMPIVGFGGKTVNFLRLFSARTPEDFNISIFNQGGYIQAVEGKIQSENVSKALYPTDASPEGKELRLVQEYFFVACAMRDIIRRYLHNHKDFDDFSSKVAIHMNDTHPAIAVAELMHLFVDDYEMPWDRAWKITKEVFGYTNHTLLPEALEKWPMPIFEKVLPRHLQIIFDINALFLKEVEKQFPGDIDRMRRMSVIEEGWTKHIRMANLAIIGSHSVNGVAAIHTDLIKKNLVPDFYEMWPDRFRNITNGVTPRRWILKANPGLAHLLFKTIGGDWITNLSELKKLEPFANDGKFRDEFAAVKKSNKERLAEYVKKNLDIPVSPDSLYDIQIKRIHLYKRQLLNVLHVIHHYLRLVDEGHSPRVPRTFLFAGKAAPGYWMAKQVIKLIHGVADVINADKKCRDWFKVVFVPDYRVSMAELIIPAADLSEQISTAGMEASGTSNMKFALNGALTIGTMDGANIEIREQVGADNIFIFGLNAAQVEDLRRQQAYHPESIVKAFPDVYKVIESIRANRFCRFEPGIFDPLVNLLMDPNDHFVHLADIESYFSTQQDAEKLFTKPEAWFTKAILNVARLGVFSSDRSIQEYAKDVWGVRPVL